MYRRYDRPLSPQTVAALRSLATTFWQAATVITERRLDAEDLQPAIKRIALTRVYVPPSTVSDAGISGAT